MSLAERPTLKYSSDKLPSSGLRYFQIADHSPLTNVMFVSSLRLFEFYRHPDSICIV